jgi:transcriptional regulator with XRE-family HTH domain
MSEFAQMLEEARKEKGLSQLRAAVALDTSPTTYRSWLRGQRPDWDRVDTLVEFIGRDEADILRALLRHNDGREPVAPSRHAKGVYLSSRSPLPAGAV